MLLSNAIMWSTTKYLWTRLFISPKAVNHNNCVTGQPAREYILRFDFYSDTQVYCNFCINFIVLKALACRTFMIFSDLMGKV
jgi:hypothetical protein